MKAKINPHGFATSYGFEYGESETYGSKVESETELVDEGEQEVVLGLDGLRGAKTYHYRVFATNSGNGVEVTSNGKDNTFETPDWSPVVTTEGAEEVIPHIYDLHGKVDPRGFSTVYGVEYGEDELLGSEVEAGEALTSIDAQDVTLSIENLKGERTYYYRFFGENEGNGTSQRRYGEKKTFVTPDYRPAVATGAVTGIGTFETEAGERFSAATFHGTINPRARDASYRFEYGTSPFALSASAPVPDGQLSAGIEDVEVSVSVEDLVPRAIYYFRLRAENEEGHHNGEIKSFTTPEWAIADTSEPAGAKTSDLAGTSCVSATLCTAVGHYQDEAGTTVSLAQHRNGGQWQIEPTPNPAGAKEAKLTAVSCAAAADCLAVGRYKDEAGTIRPLAQVYDGEGWALLPAPSPEGAIEARLESVSCVAADDCTAVGYAKTGAGAFSTLIEHYDGEAWSILSSPDAAAFPQDYLYGVSCPSAEDCWAVGRSAPTPIEVIEASQNEEELPVPTAIAMRYDGEEWSLASPPEAPTNLAAVSCSSSSWCVAATNEGLGLLAFDGSSWAPMSAPEPPEGENGTFKAVSCTSATACTAVGRYDDGENNAPMAQRWDGSEWTPQQATDPVDVIEGALLTGSLQSVSCATASACAASGFFWQGGVVQRNLLVETHPPGVAPTATTAPATDTEAPKVTLNATVNPGGEDTTYLFEYAAAGEYDPEAEDPYGAGGLVPSEPQPIGSATKAIAVATQVGSLEAGTTYHFRVLAANNQGSAHGEDETFTTPE